MSEGPHTLYLQEGGDLGRSVGTLATASGWSVWLVYLLPPPAAPGSYLLDTAVVLLGVVLGLRSCGGGEDWKREGGRRRGRRYIGGRGEDEERGRKEVTVGGDVAVASLTFPPQRRPILSILQQSGNGALCLVEGNGSGLWPRAAAWGGVWRGVGTQPAQYTHVCVNTLPTLTNAQHTGLLPNTLAPCRPHCPLPQIGRAHV